MLPSEPGGVPGGALIFAFLAFDTAALIFASKLDIAVRNRDQGRAMSLAASSLLAHAVLQQVQTCTDGIGSHLLASIDIRVYNARSAYEMVRTGRDYM